MGWAGKHGDDVLKLVRVVDYDRVAGRLPDLSEAPGWLLTLPMVKFATWPA
jgi:hypothetical protein